MRRGAWTVAVAMLVALAAASAHDVRAASNTVPGSNATRYTVAITANTLKPSSCSALTLTTIVRGVTGTSGADLILATSGADVISGAAGNDCILGGGGNDTIDGGLGTDVCLGGPGTDTFTNCETQVQ